MDDLRGTTALVTGASRGLGRAFAAALAAEGARVAALARTAPPVPPGGIAVTADVTDRAATAAAVAEATAALGPLDLVVANAGALTASGPLWEEDPDAWWRDVEVNLRGVALTLHATLPAMVARGRGRVVALGSGFGARPTPGLSAYAASKAAVHHLVAGVAGELSGTGVTALALGPGMVRTDMTRFPEGFLAYRPELRDPPGERWTPLEDAVALLLRAARGDLDDRAGEYVHVSELLR